MTKIILNNKLWNTITRLGSYDKKYKVILLDNENNEKIIMKKYNSPSYFELFLLYSETIITNYVSSLDIAPKIIDDCSLEGLITMEYYENKNIPITDIKGKEIFFFIKFLLEKINKLHKKEIYHRDIKPENILFRDIDEFKIIDYGISQTTFKNFKKLIRKNKKKLKKLYFLCFGKKLDIVTRIIGKYNDFIKTYFELRKEHINNYLSIFYSPLFLGNNKNPELYDISSIAIIMYELITKETLIDTIMKNKRYGFIKNSPEMIFSIFIKYKEEITKIIRKKLFKHKYKELNRICWKYLQLERIDPNLNAKTFLKDLKSIESSFYSFY